MKKKLILLLTILSIAGCNDRLDIDQQGKLDASTFYQNEKDFEAAILSPYSTLLNYYFDQSGVGGYKVTLFPDDDAVPSNNNTDNVEDFLWQANEGEFLKFWGTTYKGIQRANLILNRLPLASNFAVPDKKKLYEGEARFLRAFFHFQLALHFGNAPISDQFYERPEQIKVTNSQPGAIWDFVIADLKTAKENLPAKWDENNWGRATKYAAAALLGKVYLYRAQWEKNNTFYAGAATELTDVVNNGGYRLVSDFKDNFSSATENNAESLFEIQYSLAGGTNNWLPVDFNTEAAAGSGRQIMWRCGCGPTDTLTKAEIDARIHCAPLADWHGYGQVHATKSLQKEFEPNDPRRSQTIFIQGDVFKGNPYGSDNEVFKSIWSVTGSTPAKYVVQENLDQVLNQPNRSPNNERVIRYADVLLMLAEAKLLGNNDVTGAAELINQIRRRADPSTSVLPDVPTSITVSEMFKRLQHERRVELAFEGNRYSDLVRWHRAGLIDVKRDIDFGRASANQNWSPKYLVKPIPQRELDLNKELQQNQEYR